MRLAVFFLVLAIVFESFGTTMLKLSDGFTNLWPSIGVGIGFLISFTFFSFALKKISLSTAYATWSGAGTAITAMIGILIFQEHVSLTKVIALVLIILGIVIMNKSLGKKESSAETIVD
jgi:multidrug transporter EmrE-like cation transporter